MSTGGAHYVISCPVLEKKSYRQYFREENSPSSMSGSCSGKAQETHPSKTTAALGNETPTPHLPRKESRSTGSAFLTGTHQSELYACFPDKNVAEVPSYHLYSPHRSEVVCENVLN